MKKIIITLVLISLVIGVYAQSTENDNTTGTSAGVATNTGRQLLREISIDTFDDPTKWSAIMAPDYGNIQTRRIFGGPNDKELLRTEDQIGGYSPQDDFVYGVKSSFYARDFLTISIKAKNPEFMPGIVKVISVWVLGRGKNYDLIAEVRGLSGDISQISFGKLNFNGWRKLEASVPGKLVQEDPSGSAHGLYLLGFKINTDFDQTVGSYYVYFDDLRIKSDVIDEVLGTTDDIGDGW